jgi:hypothetical protein
MRIFLRVSFSILIVITLLDLGAAALAQTSNACEAILKEAEEKYVNAQFEPAIILINTCLSQAGITPKDKITAYKLLAQVCVSKGDPELAKKIFKLLLELDSQFTLITGQERPNVIQVFEEARREKGLEKLPPVNENAPVEKKGGSKKKLLLIGGGGVAVAAIVVAVLASGSSGGNGGGGAEGAFPKPPVRP